MEFSRLTPWEILKNYSIFFNDIEHISEQINNLSQNENWQHVLKLSLKDGNHLIKYSKDYEALKSIYNYYHPENDFDLAYIIEPHEIQSCVNRHVNTLLPEQAPSTDLASYFLNNSYLFDIETICKNLKLPSKKPYFLDRIAEKISSNSNHRFVLYDSLKPIVKSMIDPYEMSESIVKKYAQLFDLKKLADQLNIKPARINSFEELGSLDYTYEEKIHILLSALSPVQQQLISNAPLNYSFFAAELENSFDLGELCEQLKIKPDSPQKERVIQLKLNMKNDADKKSLLIRCLKTDAPTINESLLKAYQANRSSDYSNASKVHFLQALSTIPFSLYDQQQMLTKRVCIEIAEKKSNAVIEKKDLINYLKEGPRPPYETLKLLLPERENVNLNQIASPSNPTIDMTLGTINPDEIRTSSMTKTEFQCVVLSLRKQQQQLLNNYQAMLDERAKVPSLHGSFLSPTLNERNFLDTHKEYMAVLSESLQETNECFAQNDIDLVLTRLLSSGNLKSTSDFQFFWRVVQFQSESKYLPWLRNVPQCIINLMNLMHVDFSKIEAHDIVDGYRVLLSEVGTNETRRHQLRNAFLVASQIEVFKRIRPSLSLHDVMCSQGAEDWFSIGIKRTSNQALNEYRDKIKSQLLAYNAEGINRFMARSAERWMNQLQDLIRNNPHMTKRELIETLNSMLLTPSFIFQKISSRIRASEPNFTLNNDILSVLSNLTESLENYNNATFGQYQTDVYPNQLEMVSHYFEISESLDQESAKIKAITVPRAVRETVLAHCNFGYKYFLAEMIDKISKSGFNDIIDHQWNTCAPALDLSMLEPPRKNRDYHTDLYSFIQHVNQEEISFDTKSVQETRHDLDTLNRSKDWEIPLRAAQIEFENSDEKPYSIFDVIQDIFIALYSLFSSDFRESRREFEIAQSCEYVRAEALSVNLVKQLCNEGKSISECHRLVTLQRSVGNIPTLSKQY